MARTLHRARARAARYDGRTGSGTENTYGENAMTEVSISDGAKGDGTVGNARDDGAEEHNNAAGEQGGR